MLTWMSRILIFVFLFNTVSPELLWAQQNTASDDWTADISRTLAQTVREQLNQQALTPLCLAVTTLEDLEKRYDQKKQELLKLYNSIDAIREITGFTALNDVVSSLHSLRKEFASCKDQLLQEPSEKYAAIPHTVAVADVTYVAQQPMSSFSKVTGMLFLEELEANKYDFDDLIEKIDPIDEEFDPLVSAYAAEVVLNTLNKSLPELKGGQINPLLFALMLPRVQARVLYRLNRFESIDGEEDRPLDGQLNLHIPWNPEDAILFRGTLRILLHQIHRLYEEMGLKDPLTIKWAESFTVAPFIRPTMKTYNKSKDTWAQKLNSQTMLSKSSNVEFAPRDIHVSPDYDTFCDFMKQPWTQDDAVPDGWEAVEEANGTRTLLKDESIFREFMKKFMDEFKEFHKDAKPGNDNYSLLNLQTQYAVRYALLAGFPEEISSMVVILEGDEAPEDEEDIVDFKLKFGSILETLFATITETAKIYPLAASTVGFLQSQLLTFAGPSHATATRALALSSAGLLNISQKWNAMENPYDNQIIRDQQRAYSSVNNNLAFPDEYRQKLAAYAVDLYAPMQHRKNPLVQTPNRSKETYGLDSDQMLALSNQLTESINNLCPLQEPEAVWTHEKGYLADTDKLVTITDLNRNEYIGELANGESVAGTIPVFMFDSKGKLFDVYLYNAINLHQEKLEKAKIYARLIFEAALWVIGGEIIVFGVRALQMTRGAVVMIPKAVRTARIANKGEKLAEFGKTIQQGWLYGSTNFRATHVGATFATTRTEQVVRATAESGEHVVDGVRTARTTLEGVGATERISAPVTRFGSGWYNPTAVDITGAEYTSAGWWSRVWNGLWHETPEIGSITVRQNGVSFTLGADRLAELGVNTRRLSTSDKIAIWREIEAMPGFNLNPYGFTHMNLWHPFNPGWYRLRNGKPFIKPQNPYKILGIGKNATAQEMRTAYTDLARRWHPDRWAGSSSAEIEFAKQQMQLINGAYATLQPGGNTFKGLKDFFGTTPLMLPQQAGLGPTADQLLQLNRWNNIKNGFHRFTNWWPVNSYLANFKFFAVWFGLDANIYLLQKTMMDNTISSQTERAMNQHGDSFQPNPDDPAPNPYAADARVDVVSDVNNANSQYDAFRGALISTPVLGTMILFGKDFTKGQVQKQLDISAKRIDFSRAMNKRAFELNVQTQLNALTNVRKTYEQRMAADKDHLFTAEYQRILNEIDQAENNLHILANSDSPLPDKTAQLAKWAELPGLRKSQEDYLHKIVSINISQLEQDLFVMGDLIPDAQRYEINRLLAQAKQKDAANDINGALQSIDTINRIWNGEKTVPALTLAQEHVLAKDDALSAVAEIERFYMSMFVLIPKKDVRALEKEIKVHVKAANKEIKKVWKQKELTLLEQRARYEEIHNNLALQIETIFNTYEQNQMNTTNEPNNGNATDMMDMDEDNELEVQ